jgi:hypothetical protein
MFYAVTDLQCVASGDMAARPDEKIVHRVQHLSSVKRCLGHGNAFERPPVIDLLGHDLGQVVGIER